jgi:hypothetical protein
MTKYPYRSHRPDRSTCPERSRRACPERSRRACPERSRRACPERSRREAGTMAGQSGGFRRRRGDRRQRFFGTPFPGARKCCGPATAPAQGVVAENALPRQRCLVIPSHIRSGAERAAPQRAIAESLAENAETLRRSDVLHPQDLDLFLAGGRAHADHSPSSARISARAIGGWQADPGLGGAGDGQGLGRSHDRCRRHAGQQGCDHGAVLAERATFLLAEKMGKQKAGKLVEQALAKGGFVCRGARSARDGARRHLCPSHDAHLSHLSR